MDLDGREGGRNWEEQEEGKSYQTISYDKNIFSIKEKEEKRKAGAWWLWHQLSQKKCGERVMFQSRGDKLDLFGLLTLRSHEET